MRSRPQELMRTTRRRAISSPWLPPRGPICPRPRAHPKPQRCHGIDRAVTTDLQQFSRETGGEIRVILRARRGFGESMEVHMQLPRIVASFTLSLLIPTAL